ncbi:MAG: hypothetical protein ABIG93_01935 [archaeon]|nr:hypothetical protein [Nanoarchaeota archaeon]
MFEYKAILGIIAIVLALAGYIPYFRDIFLGKTKPHTYTWLVWASLTGIAFFGQMFDGGGAGAWVTGFTALVSFVIFFIALKKGEQSITTSDKWSLFGACIALVLWFITNNPLGSVILITLIDALGFYPTFRKSYHKPHEETMSTYFLSGLKFIIAIIALQNYTVITWLYPASLVLMNFVFVGLLVVRRKQHKKMQIPEHGF